MLVMSSLGSVPRDDFDPDSDVDVLVEFEMRHVPGLAVIRLEQELSRLLGGRRVDLVTPKFLSRRQAQDPPLPLTSPATATSLWRRAPSTGKSWEIRPRRRS